MYSGNVANTLQNEQIEFEYSDSIFYVIGEQNTVEVSIQDLYAYNGVVHVVDAVISPFIPTLEGTCGVWRLVLQSTSNYSWGDSELLLYKNDEFMESLTVFDGGADRVYDFGVDIGDEIDLYFIDEGGYTQSYQLYNADLELVVNANSTSQFYSLDSYTDIIACEEFGEDYCGKVKVQTFSDYGAGWYGGGLNVYRNGVFDKQIDMPTSYAQTTFINTNYNDTLNFVVVNPAFTDETGYLIYDTNGQIIHDENEDFVAPQNSPDLLFCEVQECPQPTGLFTDNFTFNSVYASVNANWESLIGTGVHHFIVDYRNVDSLQWNNLANLDSSSNYNVIGLLEHNTTYE